MDAIVKKYGIEFDGLMTVKYREFLDDLKASGIILVKISEKTYFYLYVFGDTSKTDRKKFLFKNHHFRYINACTLLLIHIPVSLSKINMVRTTPTCQS